MKELSAPIKALAAHLPEDEESRIILEQLQDLYSEGQLTQGELEHFLTMVRDGAYAEVLHSLDHKGDVGIDPDVTYQFGSLDTPVLKALSSLSPDTHLFIKTSDDLPDPEDMPDELDKLLEEVL